METVVSGMKNRDKWIIILYNLQSFNQAVKKQVSQLDRSI